ncbi:3-hydroxylacyl-ACP dehydratase [Uliginosibacterium sp. H3]|uniref:3-hydroxylacyl-ACP dehydratase n=1 Tax=Uliginosibacterium silvisoli TaxID=3114758 RepID=A0ABU6JYZ4_9RHOO|nr:3-hydroxylacyl-ACP dehydratase [Uliginosibacterium sp. H3]
MSERLELFIAEDHPAFAGHFPGRPIVPGALLIDLAIRAVAQATGRRISSVAQAKFLSPALPGEPLSLSFDAGADSVRFDIETAHEGGVRKLVSGRFNLHAE